jgi:hypothetical protein
VLNSSRLLEQRVGRADRAGTADPIGERFELLGSLRGRPAWAPFSGSARGGVEMVAR